MSQQVIIEYWIEKAWEDLVSSRDNLKSGRYQNAVRDTYLWMFPTTNYNIRRIDMLGLHKNVVFDENQKPIAVQIPIEEFYRLEEVIENYGLAKLIDEVSDDEQLSVNDAKNFYQSLKQNVES